MTHLLQLGGAVADLMDIQGSSVLVCLESGWDATAQVRTDGGSGDQAEGGSGIRAEGGSEIRAEGESGLSRAAISSEPSKCRHFWDPQKV